MSRPVPESARELFNRWVRAIAVRDFDKACQHLKKYVAANPGSSEGHFLLAGTLRRAVM